ncbi:MAG: hypothetical protein NZZ41_02055 [Candidatus Dojkabacteria bacterium]|nr:hypothetical protein [Candidatus Dojkabacteria bacterium]
MLIKYTKISDEIWISKENGKNTKLFLLKDDGTCIVFGDDKQILKTKDLEFILDNQEELQEIKNQYIEDYPVKHEKFFALDNCDFIDDLVKQEIKTLKFPVYSLGSEVLYCAGYWAIKANDSFDKRYIVVFCPKLSTVLKNKSSGPFKTKILAQQEAFLLSKREMKK